MTQNVTFKLSSTKLGDKAAIHIDCVGLNYMDIGDLRHRLYMAMIDCADAEHVLKIDCFPRTDQGVAKIVELLESCRLSGNPDATVTLQNASGGPLDLDALKAGFAALQQQGKSSGVGTPG